jgi:hypothetical protein
LLGVLASGFELRIGVEKELSVNWLEHFPGSAIEQVRAIRADMVASSFTVGGEGAYGVLQVREVEESGGRHARSLAAYKRPEKNNPSHAELRGPPPDNSNIELLEALARAATRKLFAVKDL